MPRMCGRSLPLLLGACACALALSSRTLPRPAPAARAATGAPASLPLPDTLVVRTRDAAQAQALAARAAAQGYAVREMLPAPMPGFAVRVRRGEGLARAFADFAGAAGVTAIEPSYPLYRAAEHPSDPLFARQSYLGVEKAPQAWDIEKGSPSVLVAVIDTGIDATHPDLRGRVWSNPREVPNNGVDDDADGCVDDARGCAFVSAASSPCAPRSGGDVADDAGHGTFVASIIAADGNGAGMIGVARNVTLLPVKVLDCEGGGDSLQLAEGIIYAVERGAKVLNVSLGGAVDAPIVREAVRIAHDEFGALIVAASGNTGTDGVSYPARYPGVLAVGAAQAADPSRRADFSTTGPEVGVVAVGERVLGAVPRTKCDAFLPCIDDQPYGVADGTSFAAPQVAGLAALVLSRHPALRPDALAGVIERTATPLPAGDRPDWAGHGRIDMLAAVTADPLFRLGVAGVTKN